MTTLISKWLITAYIMEGEGDNRREVEVVREVMNSKEEAMAFHKSLIRGKKLYAGVRTQVYFDYDNHPDGMFLEEDNV